MIKAVGPKFNNSNLPVVALGKRISCSPELIKDLPKIFNKDTMSALDNYATHKNVCIRFYKQYNHDLFNTRMYVSSSKKVTESKGLPLRLITDTKEHFCNSLRILYNQVAKLTNTFK